jgi:hypothetical protein
MSDDPNFPSLPFIPDDERCLWSEEQKWQRHLLEIEANAVLFNRRLRDGMPIAEATKLPIPWMNRHTLTEVLEIR